jgi:hypothetical protein
MWSAVVVLVCCVYALVVVLTVYKTLEARAAVACVGVDPAEDDVALGAEQPVRREASTPEMGRNNRIWFMPVERWTSEGVTRRQGSGRSFPPR